MARMTETELEQVSEEVASLVTEAVRPVVFALADPSQNPEPGIAALWGGAEADPTFRAERTVQHLHGVIMWAMRQALG